eukprot:CAMPEP_0173122290 /NCGR_PEP_ID=MMETSP1102-20130122/54029_1 /TAXON_ID=49646 /ORGANISM="Geminigera sp., Strain Caron Lab Isolate" /LENGTH=83 /DNA_ID=CAMNT_0014029531 /DNA_START=556 /DNA_END=807 /DNA_ORIENTATION=+
MDSRFVNFLPIWYVTSVSCLRGSIAAILRTDLTSLTANMSLISAANSAAFAASKSPVRAYFGGPSYPGSLTLNPTPPFLTRAL